MTRVLAANPSRKSPSTLAKGQSSISVATFRGKRISLVTFRDVYRADPLLRLSIIREGIETSYLDALASRLNMAKETLLPSLGIAPATVRRKASKAERLSSVDSERTLGLARLIGQVEDMVKASGEPEDFDAARWLAIWLEKPVAALGGQRPGELLDTSEGQSIVSNLLARMQSGAYA